MKLAGKKYVIVNADDFGQSAGVNRGIVGAHERGIVTSASLMVRWPAAAEAAAYSQRRAELSLGLHLDLGEWVYRAGEWKPLYRVIPIEDRRAIGDEIVRQLDAFRQLTGRNPTHIDSHQHVHLREPVRSALFEIVRDLALPLRHFNPAIRYCGKFYGQTTEGFSLLDVISVEGLSKILEALPEGVTELSCHPGEGNDLDTMYRNERAQEADVLCDPRVRESLRRFGIELCSFSEARQLVNERIGSLVYKEG